MSSALKLFLLILFYPGLTILAQDNRDSLIIEELTTYHAKLTQEKVHLNLDGAFFAAGDTVWFAGYVVNSKHNIPSELNHLLHVELIDDKKQIIRSYQLPLDFGYTSGEIPIAQGTKEGFYQIRAYTNWMRNFDQAYFFSTKIYIFNHSDKIASASTALNGPPQKDSLSLKIPADYDVSFFPEGGHLINGLKSKVGFKAINSNGMGVKISGKLLDDKNKVILNFNSQHAGMGVFSLTPLAGREYTAVINLPDGSQKSVLLPKSLHSGYVLSAENSSQDSLYITIQSSPDLVDGEKMLFVPLSNGVPLFYLETRFPDKTINITVPKNKTPGGIIQLYLLNSKNEPAAQRLVFNNYYKKVNLALGNLKPSYSRGEKIDLELNTMDLDGKPVIGSFSAAVINLDKAPEEEGLKKNIFSDFLLCSDIKGFVENPNYYFFSPSEEKRIELDNLMLTQGWTRFEWSDLKHSDRLVNRPFKVEDKIIISGKISGSPKAPLKNVPITLLAGELISGVILNAVTDSSGRFTFSLGDSLKQLPIRLQVKSKKKYEFLLDNYVPADFQENNKSGLADNFAISAQALIKYRALSNSISDGSQARNNFEKGIKLKDVEIKGNKMRGKLINSTSTNLNGPGRADQVFTAEIVEKLPSLPVILTQLRGVNATGSLNSNAGTSTPGILILVDGVEGFNLDNVSPEMSKV